MDIPYPLDSFTGVAASSRATVALPPGPVYDTIMLEYNYDAVNFNKSHIPTIDLNLNGENIIDGISASDFIMMEAYEGNAEQTGYITIDLRERIANTLGGSNLTGLVTQPGDAISLSVDIGATGITPTLKGFVVTSPRYAGQVRTHVYKIQKFPAYAGAGGKFDQVNYPRGPRYKRVHFSGANITGLTVERDQKKIYELTKARAEMIAKRHQRVPQTNYFHFDPIVDGYAAEKMMVSQSTSLKFTLDMSAAGDANAIIESLWPEFNPAANVAAAQGGTRRGRRRL